MSAIPRKTSWRSPSGNSKYHFQNQSRNCSSDEVMRAASVAMPCGSKRTLRRMGHAARISARRSAPGSTRPFAVLYIFCRAACHSSAYSSCEMRIPRCGYGDSGGRSSSITSIATNGLRVYKNILDIHAAIDDNAANMKRQSQTRKAKRIPKFIRCQPRSWRLYEAIDRAAEAEFMTRASWLMRLASRHLGVPDSDEEQAA